jgi:hypothetical protein
MLDMTQKVVGIHSIFNKDKNGHYTKKALLYQDIITYSIAKKKESFKDKDSFRHWDLAKYLMNKNAEYINRYKDPSSKHTPIKNRIENTQRRTKDNVQHIIDLGLMKKSDYVKESKGTGSIPTFTYTQAGCLFAWIIQSFDPNKRSDSEKEIYKILHDSMFNITDESSSVSIFFSSFFKKMYEKNFFGKYVECFRELLDNRTIMTFEEFFQYISIPRLKDKNTGAKYLRLWSDTINELKPQVKELVLYNLKLDLERRMEKQAEFYKDYEKVRFAIRDKPHMIAIEGHCKQCNHVITFPISLRMYNERIAYAHIIPLVIKCHNCGKKDSLNLPYLI